MQRTPNGLIRCPQSGPLERLITSTKSKKGKTGRLSMSSQDRLFFFLVTQFKTFKKHLQAKFSIKKEEKRDSKSPN